LAEDASVLAQRIENKTATVCIVGLGYVGLPLAVASAEAGFSVVGVDVDKGKVDLVNRGVCYVEDSYVKERLSSLVSAGKIKATAKHAEALPGADIVIVCVPTPLDARENPDLSFLRTTAKAIAQHLKDYKLIIIESTSYPGTTEELIQPILEKSGKKAGEDFALVYSPERIDYGNSEFGMTKIPKVVGGLNAESTRLGSAFYTAILQARVVSVSGPSVAEATKMLENVFRYVNIALVNELAVLHEELGVDFIEAIDAAATKPFGFMPHYPGPGVGGHCIPKDPFYLVYKAKKAGYNLRLVQASKAVNREMPVHVVERLSKSLREKRKTPRKSKIVLWGLAYKGEVKDTRRSPSLDLLKLFKRAGFKVQVYDPYVPKITVGGLSYESARSLLDSVDGADALVIATNHKMFAKPELSELKTRMKDNPILFDTRNLRSRKEAEESGFTYLATGRP
jgi:UDP-N-acetyl-D-glucosamine dehydrogenase